LFLQPQSMGSYPPRNNIILPKEFRRLWTFICDKVEEDASDEVETTKAETELNQKDGGEQLLHLKDIFETHLECLRKGIVTFNNIEASDLESALQIISHILEHVDPKNEGHEDFKPKNEIKFSAPETLTELFNQRPVYVVVDRVGNYNFPMFWLTSVPPAFELDTYNEESELVRYIKYIKVLY
jgi:hypothetical protein